MSCERNLREIFLTDSSFGKVFAFVGAKMKIFLEWKFLLSLRFKFRAAESLESGPVCVRTLGCKLIITKREFNDAMLLVKSESAKWSFIASTRRYCEFMRPKPVCVLSWEENIFKKRNNEKHYVKFLLKATAHFLCEKFTFSSLKICLTITENFKLENASATH